MRLLADLFLVVGAAFCLLGALGLLRMPDVYNRIQSGTKAVTLGALAFLIGIALLIPGWWPKLAVIAGFILLTNPIGSSTIARAIHIAGIEAWKKESWKSEALKKSRGAACGAGLMMMLAALLVLIMLIAALAALLLRNAVAAVAAFAVVSLALSVLFVWLRAPDVALTEAAVGGGLSSLILALALRRLGLWRVGGSNE